MVESDALNSFNVGGRIKADWIIENIQNWIFQNPKKKGDKGGKKETRHITLKEPANCNNGQSHSFAISSAKQLIHCKLG